MSESEVFTKLPLWEQTQYKTFRNWVNINLTQVKSTISQLESDFKNGTRLAQLIEILQKKTIGKWNKEPKRQMQELENLNMAITAIQKDNVKIVNIGSTDLNQGNLKIILGLIWTLIQHYHINQLDFLDEETPILATKNNENVPTLKKEATTIKVKGLKKLNAKDKLLAIVNEIVKPWGYKANNFTTDFQNGKILACLAHTRDPKLTRDPASMGDNNQDNAREALEGLEKLGVPHVMDVIAITEQHDEKSMMTLLGYVIKVLSTRDQVVFGPGEKGNNVETKPVETKPVETKPVETTSNNNQVEEEEELLDDNVQVHSSKTENTNTVVSDLPKLKVDKHSLFNRFVEIGRVVLINYGEYEGKIAAILDVIDANSVLVAGPSSGVPRQPISIKRLQLTDIVVPMRRNPRPKTLEKAWNESRAQEYWDRTSWAQKLASRKRKTEMNDFDRFKALVAHQKRAKLIRAQRKQLQPSKKSKK